MIEIFFQYVENANAQFEYAEINSVYEFFNRISECLEFWWNLKMGFVENFKLILMSYLWQRKNDVTESYDVTKYGSTEKREIVQKRYFAPISAPIELKTSYYMYFGMRNPFLMFIWV